MRIALGLEYDGAAFCGWQTQPGGCGVQDHLEQALQQFLQVKVEAVAAGRTDAGVHATAQVVHLDCDIQREPHSWVRGTNSNMHPGARVLWAQAMPPDFHARYSARARTYRYLLVNAPVAPAVMRTKAGWHHRPLDVERMQQAAQALVGEHDFSSFRDAECQAKTPIRNLTRVTVERQGELVRFTLVANAFLHHMVRNIVGSLVYVGDGRQPPEWIAELRAQRDRRNAAPTFMPDGLYLAGIEYDRAFTLPAFPPHAFVDAP